MPWTGSTSMFGMLRAAMAKPSCSWAPSMISALVRPRPEKCATSAAAELRHPGRAVTGTAGALLLVHLLAGAPDVGATLRLVGAGLTLGELPVDAALDDVLARLEAENGVRQLNRTSRLAFKGCDFQFHLTRPPARPALRLREPVRRHRRPGGTCPASAR